MAQADAPPLAGARVPPVASLHMGSSSATILSEQCYAVTAYAVRPLAGDRSLRSRHERLARFLTPRFLSRRSLLDVDAGCGFFCLWALHNGAARATALCRDDGCARALERVREAFGFHALDVLDDEAGRWHGQADVVVAVGRGLDRMAMELGSLGAAIDRLARLSRDVLLVECARANDGPWEPAEVERALEGAFTRVSFVGTVEEGGALYAAMPREHQLVHVNPLPLLYPEDTVIYSRRLTSHEGIEYWSRVHDLGDRIVKQATLDLAAREGRVLARLGGPRFPRVLQAEAHGRYSVLTLEKVDGVAVGRLLQPLRDDAAGRIELVRSCLDILASLRTARIAHRDIKPDNLLVRAGQPVLIDFGWSQSDDDPVLTPRWLGEDARPPDGRLDDVYSMGRILEMFLPEGDPLRLVSDLMTAHDPLLRIRDPAVLQHIADGVAGGGR